MWRKRRSINQDPPKSAWETGELDKILSFYILIISLSIFPTELEKKRREISKESWKKAFEKGAVYSNFNGIC